METNEIMKRVRIQAINNAYLNVFQKIGILLLNNQKVSALIFDSSENNLEITESELEESNQREECDLQYRGAGGSDVVIEEK